jgi:predicted dehydrogenase
MKAMRVAIVGIGGFGKVHVQAILRLVEQGLLTCTAFAEVNPSSYPIQFDALTTVGAQFYEDYMEMLRQHPEIDFVVMPTPIPLHKSMSIYAMEQGFHVLLEKPPAVIIQDIEAMIETQKRTGKHCQINFQLSSCQSFHKCLEKLQCGSIGTLLSVTGVGIWHRARSYYERTSWAGKLFHNGKYVLDGTMNNPFAHLLNNCLIAAGYGDPVQAEPLLVQAECYKAHEIEGEDTTSARIHTRNGVKIHYYATLCNDVNEVPYLILEGSQGWMRWSYDHKLIIHNEQGEEIFEADNENLFEKMYVNLMDTIRGESKLYSSLEDCRSFVLASNGAFESAKQIHRIPEKHITTTPVDQTETVTIHNIKEIIEHASTDKKLFSEDGLEWAVASESFSMQDYREFRMFDKE